MDLRKNARRKFWLAITLFFIGLLSTPAVFAQQTSIPVQGGGTLTYTMTYNRMPCDSQGIFYVNEWDFSNFKYTDDTGVSHSMPAYASAFQVTGDNRDHCPTPPSNSPIALKNQGITVTFVPGTGYASATLNSVSGFVKLKYQVLGVDYAPPGSKSSVNYSGSTMRGTSTSNSSSWTNNTSLSVSVGAKAKFLFASAGGSVTATSSYEQGGDNSKSVTVSTTTNQGDTIPGPLSSTSGIDHNYDVIWVWLNPELQLTIPGPYQLQWNGYAVDPHDDANEMEVVPIYVIQLKNPSLMSTGLASRLARSWDSSGLGGLTTQDFASILAADPFAANPSLNPNTDTTGRFDLQAGQTFAYAPAPPGGQPITQTYSLVSQSTSSLGQGSSDTRSVGMTIDQNFSIGLFGSKLSLDIKASDTYTSSNKWSSSINGGAGQTAALSITGPAASDNYTGPTTIQVWKDNVYGSFMFYGVR
jgi:hypothetical protein